VFTNAGEILESPRGSGFQIVDGFRQRTKVLKDVDQHLDYGLRLMGDVRIVGIVDVFNICNFNTATNYDSNSETTFGVLSRVSPRVPA